MRLERMCEIMPAVLLGDAASAESCSSCRWTGSNTYHRSLKCKKKKKTGQRTSERGRVDGTFIVSSQLNVASVMNKTMARVAHLVSGSLFGAILLHWSLGDSDFVRAISKSG